MRPARRSYAWILSIVSAGTAIGSAYAQEYPILPALTAEELAMKDNPLSPGASAMILYLMVDTDNTKSTETHAVRLKVFREEGRKYADIEIPYFKDTRVEDIRARTVDVSGKTTEFAEQVYDREIVKAKKFRVNAKVFTLPNVQPGTIIEYTYRFVFKEKIPDVFKHPEHYLITTGFTYPAARWAVQQDLFVQHAHLTLHKVTGAQVREHTVNLPEAPLQYGSDGLIRVDLQKIPPFEQEEYSPPEDTIRARLDLYYAVGFSEPSYYWTEVSRRRATQYEGFLKKSKVIDREAAKLVDPKDSEETKLRKIYARVQQIRAVSFEAEKTDKERKQENLIENKNVEEVLTRGYAYANQINLLFVALARAAGLDAYPYEVASRKNAVFMEDWPNEYQLNSMVVQVRTGGGMVYLDPATKFCPFGMLPWDESEAGGIRVDKSSPGWGLTPKAQSKDAVTRRKADLHLKDDGTLIGKVEVIFSGQEALIARLQAMGRDDAAREKDLEDSIKSLFPQGGNAKLVRVDGLEKPEDEVRASFEVEIPNFATHAGRRLILPVGMFHLTQTNPFSSPRRVNPIYFTYPHESYEEVRLELPDGMQVESLPSPRKTDQNALYYEFSNNADGNVIRFNRTLRFNGYVFDRQQYPRVRAFYDRVMAGDSQQATLVPRQENAAKQ